MRDKKKDIQNLGTALGIPSFEYPWDAYNKQLFEKVEEDTRQWIGKSTIGHTPLKVEGKAPVIDWYSIDPMPRVYEHKALTAPLAMVDEGGGLFICDWKLAMLQAIGFACRCHPYYVYTHIDKTTGQRTVFLLDIAKFRDKLMTSKRRSPVPHDKALDAELRGYRLKTNLWTLVGTY